MNIYIFTVTFNTWKSFSLTIMISFLLKKNLKFLNMAINYSQGTLLELKFC